MNTLLDCDDVFDRLTRAPFPTGAAADDELVERHLEACHECRQLAEALRPAVACFDVARQGIEVCRERHRSATPEHADDACSLPVYRGRVGTAARRSSVSSIVVAIGAALLLSLAVAQGWNGARGPRVALGGADVGGLSQDRAGDDRLGEGNLIVASRMETRPGPTAQEDWFRRHLHVRCQSPTDERVVAAHGAGVARQQCCTLCHSLQAPQAARPTQVAMSRLVAACLLCHEG